MSVVEQYPYLWATILATAILLAVALVFLESKRVAIFSGVLHAPAGLFGFTLTDYYKPQKLGGFSVGIEDVMFGFASGLAVWLLATPWPFARSLRFELDAKFVHPRVVLFAVLASLTYLGLWAVGDNSLTALLATLGLLGGFVLVRRRELWPLAIPAAITYPVLHGLATAFAFAAWPGLSIDWTAEHFWGSRLLLQTPLGEVAWAAAFGASWPLVVAYLLDARPGSERGRRGAG